MASRGRIVQPGSRNLTPEQKYSASIGKRVVPLREFSGRGRNGELQGPCVWHDMHTNRTVPAGENWEQPPPDLPSGDQGRLPSCLPPSERYRTNFAKIDWAS